MMSWRKGIRFHQWVTWFCERVNQRTVVVQDFSHSQPVFLSRQMHWTQAVLKKHKRLS